MVRKNLIMVTTHQDDLNVYKLLKSLNDNLKDITTLIVVVSQESPLNFVATNPSLSLTVINETKMGLSKARNIALKFLLEHNITSDYIMFPDDDSTFDGNFFADFRNILGTDNNYLGPIYNEGSQKLYLGKETEEGKLLSIKDYKLVGSPNQIICYDKVKHHIFFDEELGVGAKYGSSEDFDLYIKMNLLGCPYYFTNKLYSFHPAKTAVYKKNKLKIILKRFKNYSSGFAFVVFRYNLFYLVPNYLFRTLIASVVYFLKLNFILSLAYLIQFYLRVQLLVYFTLIKNRKD